MVLPQFLLPIPIARVGARSVSARKENQMMGKKKKIGNCGNAIAENGRKKKKKVCGNGIAEIEVINFWQLWQWRCRNRGVKKNFWNCEKWNGIRQCHCHNCQNNFFFFSFSAMALPQLPKFFFPRHLVFLVRTRAAEWVEGIAVIPLPKIKLFLSSTFYLFLSNFC